MKYTECKPNATEYLLKFNSKEDKEMCRRCTWARITLDHDTFTMTANTDCGNYSYSWSPDDTESFVKLMSRIDKCYLLGKISAETKFNLEKSKELTIKNLCQIEEYRIPSHTSLAEMEKNIRNFEFDDETLFYLEVELETCNLLDYESIDLVKEYPGGAITFVDIFCDYLQPILKNSLKKDATSK